MHVPPGDRTTRRRHFHGVGRYPGMLQQAAAELSPDGTDYLLLPEDQPEPALAPLIETVQQLLPLTRQEILGRWPESEPPPRGDSLWRTLMRGCERGSSSAAARGTRRRRFGMGWCRALRAPGRATETLPDRAGPRLLLNRQPVPIPGRRQPGPQLS